MSDSPNFPQVTPPSGTPSFGTGGTPNFGSDAGPSGADPGSDFANYMNHPKAAAPQNPSMTTGSSSFSSPTPKQAWPRQPHTTYPMTTANGLPNAQYFFHFGQGDVICQEPYSAAPPAPTTYQNTGPNGKSLYPGASIVQQTMTMGGQKWYVSVISTPLIPNPPNPKDPNNANPAAKYYEWNYMYVSESQQGPWLSCGSGPSLKNLPENEGTLQTYFPFEYLHDFMIPLAKELQQQSNWEKQQSDARKKIYQDEAQG